MLKVETVLCESLILDPANVRRHDEKNLEAIKGSLARFGQRKPIVVRGNVVVAGNGTLTAARALGLKSIDIVRADDMSPAEAAAFSITDNRTSDLSSFDDAELALTLKALEEQGLELGTLGFDPTDLEQLYVQEGIADVDVDEDQVPEPPEAPVTMRGDLWVLGEHRLLCGDSASTEDVDRLLGGATIQLVNTDPPYNVKVEPRSNNAIAAGSSGFAAVKNQTFDLARHPGKSVPTTMRLRPRDRFLDGDFLPDDEFYALLRRWFGNLARVLEPGRSFYVWGGYSNWKNYCTALADCGLYFSHGIVWVKEHPVLTRKDMLGNFECCWHGWREGAAHQWFGPNNITDVWEVKKVNPQSMVHLTEKPVELARRAIQYSSRPGENVIDLFGGSGSTLIAAEETGRKAYLMEIDPPYCDVIVTRWQTFTGKTAVLDVSGTTFADAQRARCGSTSQVR